MFIESDRLAKHYESLLKKENPELHSRIKKAVAEAKKDIDNHFKRDKWDLDYYLYKDDVITDILGINAAQYISFSLTTGKNYNLSCTDNGLKITYNRAKRASKSKRRSRKLKK